MDDSDQSSVLFVVESCNVTRERALELLQAGSGSIERAVAIHFSQVGTQTARKKARTESPVMEVSPVKQPTLISFFGQKQTPRSASKTKGSGDRTTTNLVNDETKSTEAISEGACTCQKHKDSIEVAHSKINNIEDIRLRYWALADAFSVMAATTKRLVKLDELQRVLKDVIEAVGGVGGREHDRIVQSRILHCTLELILGSAGTTLQVSGSAVSKAVLAVTGVSRGQLREAYRKTGDLGDASELFVRNQTLLIQPKPLTISQVHDTLKKIASREGRGSQQQRHTLMVKLLRSCKNNELKFLVRTLLGNMRLGANLRTVLAALGAAVEMVDAATSNREANTTVAAKAVQDTFDYCPRFDRISSALLCGGIRLMQEICVLQVGTPINPMLANPAHSLEEVRKLMEPKRSAVAEWKYDGVRCQAHWDGSQMSLFSRHLLDTTEQFPDAVKSFLDAKLSNVQSFIVDSEIVGVEPDDNGNLRLLPFQDLSSRRGTFDENKADVVQLCIFAFDLIYLNGESLVNESLYKRRSALVENFQETSSFAFTKATPLESYNGDILRATLEQAVKGGAEGLMVKLTGEEGTDQAKNQMCVYESGARSQSWLKVKRDYVQGFSDTIDVVPIGAWYGNGRKAQKSFLSPVLLAVYDEEQDVFRSISRCMTFTDAMYEATREFYFHGTAYPTDVGLGGIAEDAASDKAAVEDDASDNQVTFTNSNENDIEDSTDDNRINCYPSRPHALVVTNENPSIWFKPSEVWEVTFADLTLSRTHTAGAGLVGASQGVALRFPRFKRRRPDKRIDQATTSAQIAELFSKQCKQVSKRSTGSA